METQSLLSFSKRILITVPGEPVAKERHRYRIITPKNGKPFAQPYTPSDTRKYEEKIREEAKKVMGDLEPYDCRIWMIVTAYRPLLSGFSKKKREAALSEELVPLTKPDSDNYMKAAKDALNGIVYRDDALVADEVTRKRYSDQPRLEIEVCVA